MCGPVVYIVSSEDVNVTLTGSCTNNTCVFGPLVDKGTVTTVTIAPKSNDAGGLNFTLSTLLSWYGYLSVWESFVYWLKI